MSDLLDAAAAALGTPASLVQRSAAARAAETGATVDDILAAWAGGAPVAEAAPPPATAPEPEPVPVEETPTAPAVVVETPVIEAPPLVVEAAYEPEREEPLEPVPLGRRVRTAVRVGAWTGAALGVVGFLVAGAFWATTAAVVDDTGPIVQVGSTAVLIGVALVSILFGAIVAGLSRSAASWTDPAMQLSGSKATTAWIGAVIGLVIGVGAGVLLTAAVGTEIEGSEGLVQLPVLPTLAVMLLGGAVLGAITAAIPQLLGTPVAIDEDDHEELETVRTRLGHALSVPVAGLLLLALLVLPFAFTLIQSNRLAGGAAAVVAIITAGGILGFGALAGNRPEVRISFGELMVALVGVGTVLLILLAVLVFNAPEETEGEGGAEHGSAQVLVL